MIRWHAILQLYQRPTDRRDHFDYRLHQSSSCISGHLDLSPLQYAIYRIAPSTAMATAPSKSPATIAGAGGAQALVWGRLGEGDGSAGMLNGGSMRRGSLRLLRIAVTGGGSTRGRPKVVE